MLNMARTYRDLALIMLLDMVIILVLVRALILTSGAVVIAVLLVHGVVRLLQSLELNDSLVQFYPNDFWIDYVEICLG